ncbi:hypothetical protein XYCOK13_42260 [Xylanibacillus composti]|uniref:Uncharacterized protein n=1 Tax=Xylanibacillus composti TaxID=1572762 RepID=A0A8J4H5M4_9BACL|nr:hypothetical protein XYCOK13_42260 [Xylanibacillus composti]
MRLVGAGLSPESTSTKIPLATKEARRVNVELSDVSAIIEYSSLTLLPFVLT